MNCEQVQPNLLDYSRKLLTGHDHEEIEAHLRQCAECSEVLREEIAFAARLDSLPEEQPVDDVWALVRSKTRPRTVRPLVWLHGLVSTNVRRVATASVVLAALSVGFYNLVVVQPQTVADQHSRPPVVAVYSDDPLGGHTDAVIDSIDDM